MIHWKLKIMKICIQILWFHFPNLKVMWVGGWMGVKAVLRIAYSSQQLDNIKILNQQDRSVNSDEEKVKMSSFFYDPHIN